MELPPLRRCFLEIVKRVFWNRLWINLPKELRKRYGNDAREIIANNEQSCAMTVSGIVDSRTIAVLNRESPFKTAQRNEVEFLF